MAQSTITFRIDEDIKNQLNEICEALGMTVSGALTICSKMIINKGGLPFDVRLETPNFETLKAMAEAEALANNPNIKSYKTTEEVMKALEEE